MPLDESVSAIFAAPPLAADFLVVTEREVHCPSGPEALRKQGFGRLVQGHHRAFVIQRTAAPDESIRNDTGEWRLQPLACADRIDGHDVLVRHDQNRLKGRIGAGPFV